MHKKCIAKVYLDANQIPEEVVEGLIFHKIGGFQGRTRMGGGATSLNKQSFGKKGEIT